ncbi:MAG: ABC transporter permease [Bacteroidota bacterium]
MPQENLNKPPESFLRFFRWYCHPDYLEDLEGDLLERFERNADRNSIRSAKTGFVKDVIKLFRPGIIRPLYSNQQLNDLGMLKNYITIATRNLLKQKLYSSINIGGLAVGLSCFIMIFIYVQHELSFDNFYSHKDNIYRIYQRQLGNMYQGTDYFAVTPAGLASTFTAESSEVENATSVVQRPVLLTADEASFFESGLWTDKEFFNIFDYEFIKGNARKAFEQPMAIVVTESFATKLFSETNALGRSIVVSSHYGDHEYNVTGVIKDLPSNSSLQFTYVLNLASDPQYLKSLKNTVWRNSNYQTFCLLKPKADPTALQDQLSDITRKYEGENENEPAEKAYYIQPLSELHLESNINFDIGLKGNVHYLMLFSGIAIIVLILACVNYMNLAIARSIQRAKEVGLRKVIGAIRRQLIAQFLGESVFIALMALVIAIALSYWLLPYFGLIIERPLRLDLVDNPLLLPILSGLILFVGLFSGSYPSIFMSSLKPVNTLKGQSTHLSPKMKLQSILIVVQYTASIVLIISSLVIYLQFDFIQNKELGYNKDHIIVVNTRSAELRKNFDPVKNELLKQSSILSVSTSNFLPSNIGSSTTVYSTPDNVEAEITMYNNSVDYDYLKTFGIELAAGRDFSLDLDSDRSNVIINETAAKTLGWTPAEAIGEQFFQGQNPRIVVGVVKDFHMFSMHLAIQPLMLTLRRDYFSYASMKVSPNSIQSTILSIEEAIQQHSKHPFEFQFMDDEFDRLYKADIKLGKIFGTFTVISVLIASLGLFGLAAYTTKQRTKEMGIRKILGASVRTIVSLASQDFLKMVIIGFILSIPIAWFLMDIWLQDYAYHIGLEWWVFAVSGLIAAILSLLTVGSQSIKVSLENPVNTLRSA